MGLFLDGLAPRRWNRRNSLSRDRDGAEGADEEMKQRVSSLEF